MHFVRNCKLPEAEISLASGIWYEDDARIFLSEKSTQNKFLQI